MARARDAERLRRREEETRKERLGAEQTKKRGDELAAKLRDAETRARDAERRLAEMERLEAERRKRSDQLGGEVTRDELLNRRGLRLPTQRDAGVIGGDANPPRFANPPPGYAAFERPKPFADGEKRAAPIGPVVGGGDSVRGAVVGGGEDARARRRAGTRRAILRGRAVRGRGSVRPRRRAPGRPRERHVERRRRHVEMIFF